MSLSCRYCLGMGRCHCVPVGLSLAPAMTPSQGRRGFVSHQPSSTNDGIEQWPVLYPAPASLHSTKLSGFEHCVKTAKAPFKNNWNQNLEFFLKSNKVHTLISYWHSKFLNTNNRSYLPMCLSCL